mgnify:CR=1 FL=1
MSNSKFKVGIVGNGFVGEAIAFAFSTSTEIRIYDKIKEKSTHSINKIYECDFVFVCVPTPMYENGEQDLTYIEDVFNNAQKGPIYIIKSTVIPGTTKKMLSHYDLDIIFSPEFLTERTAKLDVMTQSRIIFGGDKELTKKVRKLFDIRFMNKHFIETDSTTAELVKYMNNSFLATKISIMNEFKLLCDKINGNWQDALNGFASDGRIGDSHLHVPGHDGKLGYGGTCFPKDVNSLLFFAKSLNIELNSIEGGWKTNLSVRPEKDWEKKLGRSVSKKTL